MASTSPRVERGAAFLDMTAPGWETRINLDTLALDHSQYCLLGQLYGDYDEAIEAINGDVQRIPVSFGFIAQANETYEALTDKWRVTIMRRLRKLRAA